MDRDRYDDDKNNNTYTEVYVWGGDHYGQLGLGQKYIGKTYPDPKICSFNLVIRDVSCGEEHAAFVTYRGHIYTMGSNTQGRLGIGNKSIRQSSSPCLVEELVDYNCKQISCGWGHTIAVMGKFFEKIYFSDRGEAFTWGVGEHGALGHGSNENAWSPIAIVLDPYNPVGCKKASAGSRHSAFISEYGVLYTSGSGDAGQLGTGKRESKLVPEQVTLLSERVQDVACGIFHTLILTETGRVYSTGGNTFGQLGLGNKKNTNIPTRIREFEKTRISKIACSHHSAAVSDRGDLYVWGTGIFGEYLVPTKYSSAAFFKEVSVGGFFGTAIDDEGVPWTWGSNTSGELGQGDFEPRNSPTTINFLANKRTQKVSCGGSFAIALGENKSDKPERPEPRQSLQHRPPSPVKRESVKESQMRLSTGKFGDGSFARKRTDESGDRLETSPDRKSRSKSPAYINMSKTFTTGSKYKSPYATEGPPVRFKTLEDTFDSEKPKERESILSNLIEKERVGREDPFVDLLIKQKSLLENSLKHERDERRILENSLIEMKRRVRELQEGPEGLIELSESLAKQNRKFEELKQTYDEECLRKERLNLDFTDSRKQIDNLMAKVLPEKDKIIHQLEQRLFDFEVALKDSQHQLDSIKESSSISNEKLRDELFQKDSEVQRLSKTIRELSRDCERAGLNLEQLEKIHLNDIETKKAFESENNHLAGKLKEFALKLDEALLINDREAKDRRLLEEENAHLKARELEIQDRNRELREENARLKAAIEKSIEAEHIKNERFREEREYLNGTLLKRDQEIDELKAKVVTLEVTIVEIEDKNKKLVDLLNNEIQERAEEFKKKALQTLFGPAKRLADNLTGSSMEDFSSLEAEMERQKLLRKNYETARTSVRQREQVPEPIEEVPAHESSPEKLRRVIENPDATPKNQYEIYTQDLRESHQEAIQKDFDSTFQAKGMSSYEKAAQEIEESKRRLSSSAHKLMNLLELGEDPAPTNADRDRIRFKTPKRGSQEIANKRQPVEELSSSKKKLDESFNNSGKKSIAQTPVSAKKQSQVREFSHGISRGASPFKMSKIEEEDVRETGKGPAGDYIQNLREVKERLASLQKNKHALESKMQDFEKKLQNIK